MALISKNVYIDKLDNLIHGYNNIYQRKIKIKLLDVESNRYIDSGIQNNEKDPKFGAGDHVRISK